MCSFVSWSSCQQPLPIFFLIRMCQMYNAACECLYKHCFIMKASWCTTHTSSPNDLAILFWHGDCLLPTIVQMVQHLSYLCTHCIRTNKILSNVHKDILLTCMTVQTRLGIWVTGSLVFVWCPLSLLGRCLGWPWGQRWSREPHEGDQTSGEYTGRKIE